MPVRKIGLCYRSVAGLVPMGAGRRTVRTESTLERDFVLLKKFDRDVLDVEEQPVRIPYRQPTGRMGNYVPDFLVTYRTGPKQLAEVKYSSDPILLSPAFRFRIDAARSYAAERRWEFHLVTEKEIRGPKLTNIRFLLPYRSRVVDGEIRRAIVATVTGRPGLGLSELVRHLADGPVAASEFVSAIWTMVGTAELAVDLDMPLTERVQILLGR
jgi:hypothetical protein